MGKTSREQMELFDIIPSKIKQNPGY